MMKTIKMMKFQIADSLVSVRSFYMVVIVIMVLLAYVGARSAGDVTSSGLEAASAIFLFVLGLNSARSSFKFSQANSISRKTYMKGMVLGVFPIAMIMSAADLIINRVFNVFAHGPTNFEMIYGTLRGTEMWDVERGVLLWKQANDFYTLFSTLIWQFAVYSAFFLLGILISMIYYRCNKAMKVAVSIIPFILLMLSYNIYILFPASFWMGLNRFIAAAFGWESRNPYIAVLSFIVLGAVFSAFTYLLTRRAVVKE